LINPDWLGTVLVSVRVAWAEVGRKKKHTAGHIETSAM